MANFFQLVLSLICTESPSPSRFANFKIILSPEGMVNAHNNCNCKDDKKLISLDIQIMHLRMVNACSRALLVKHWRKLKLQLNLQIIFLRWWWILTHKNCSGRIEESFSSSFRLFCWSGGECFLFTKIALEGLKKNSSQSLDHSPEVVVNTSCSQELLRKEKRKLQLRLNIILLKWWWNAQKNCIARLKKAQSWTIFFFLRYDPCGQ